MANLPRRAKNPIRPVRQENLCQAEGLGGLHERTLHLCKTIKGGVLMGKNGSKTISGGNARLHLQSVDKND